MAVKDKIAVKVFLSPEANEVLDRNKDKNGVTKSHTVEDLIMDVLAPELEGGPERQPGDNKAA